MMVELAEASILSAGLLPTPNMIIEQIRHSFNWILVNIPLYIYIFAGYR